MRGEVWGNQTEEKPARARAVIIWLGQRMPPRWVRGRFTPVCRRGNGRAQGQVWARMCPFTSPELYDIRMLRTNKFIYVYKTVQPERFSFY